MHKTYFETHQKIAETIDAINRHISKDIDEVYKEVLGLDLKWVGGNARINPCPLCGHNDCFTLTPEVVTYHCFSCERAGGHYQLFQELSGKPQFELFTELCGRYGVTIPSEVEKEFRIQEIRRYAADFYHDQLLASPEALKHQEQVRKHSKETLKLFKVGFSKGFNKLREELQKVGYTVDEIKEAKVWFPDQMSVYPYIHPKTGRIRFNCKPVNKEAQPTGFSHKKDSLLYSPEFSYDQAIAVEGENDLLSMYEAGVKSVVATSGQLTPEQYEELEKVKVLYAMFDNDHKGKMYTEQLNCRLPHVKIYKINYDQDVKDPDELLKTLDCNIDELIKAAELLPSYGCKIKHHGSRWVALNRDTKFIIEIQKREKDKQFYGECSLHIDGKAVKVAYGKILSFTAKGLAVDWVIDVNKEMTQYYDQNIPGRGFKELLEIYWLSTRKGEVVRSLAEHITEENREELINQIEGRLGVSVKDQVLKVLNELDNADVDVNADIPKLKISQFLDLKNDIAFVYFNMVEKERDLLKKLPYYLTNRKELIRLDLFKRKDPQCMLLVKKRYELPFEVPTAPMELKETSLHQRWVYKYIDGEIKDWELQPNKLIRQLEDILRRFIYFADERIYKILALWTYGTYAYELFSEFPYLFLNGKKGSGKSTQLNVLYVFCFNAKFSAHISEAALYRTLEFEGGTFMLDEMEKLSDSRKALESDLLPILLAGYSKSSGNVYRCNPEKNNAKEGFNVYGPKVISNIRGLYDVLHDRMLPIEMKPVASSKLKEIEDIENYKKYHPDEINELRSKYVLSVLENYKTIYKVYTEERIDGDTPRMAQIMKPIYALAKVAGQEYVEAVDSYLKDIRVIKKDIEDTTPEGIIKRILTELAFELKGKADYKMSRFDALVPEGALVEQNSDWFKVNQLWLKVAMESYSPDCSFEMKFINTWVKQVTGINIEEDRERTTVSLDGVLHDDLAKEVGKKPTVYVYRFYFADFLKLDGEASSKFNYQGDFRPTTEEVIEIVPVKNEVLPF